MIQCKWTQSYSDARRHMIYLKNLLSEWQQVKMADFGSVNVPAQAPDYLTEDGLIVISSTGNAKILRCRIYWLHPKAVQNLVLTAAQCRQFRLLFGPIQFSIKEFADMWHSRCTIVVNLSLRCAYEPDAGVPPGLSSADDFAKKIRPSWNL